MSVAADPERPLSYELPSRLPGYLLRLWHQYRRTRPALHEVIAASRILVIEETDYDNLDGGQHGHDVRLYVPMEVLAEIDIDDQLSAAQEIGEDLRKLSQNVRGEFISTVHLEMAEHADADYRRATPFSGRPQISPDSLPIWKRGLVRVFISHRDGRKADAHTLAEALEPFGFTSFVAHDTIPANEEWRRVIVGGLETMEVMLAFLTDDFEESIWTMQEVGYALGKGVPCVSLKLERRDPPGFISHTQALRGSLTDLHTAARKLAPLLAKALGQQDRLQAALVASFAASPNWTETRSRFDRMAEVVERLTDQELQLIIESYRKNDQLHAAAYLSYRNHTRLRSFLERTTDKEFEVEGRAIREQLPF